jgi:hypothetical protein
VLGRRLSEEEFLEDIPDVLLDRGLTDDERFRDALVGLTLGHHRQHLPLAWTELVQWSAAASAPEHPSDDHGVERGAAVCDPLDGVDEHVDVGYALLEQVTNALGTVANELQRVLLLVVLREDQYGGLGTASPQLDRGVEPIAGAFRRHLHVRDDHIRAVRQRLSEQVGSVTGPSDHLMARVLEETRDPLAHQHVILADHDAQ